MKITYLFFATQILGLPGCDPNSGLDTGNGDVGEVRFSLSLAGASSVDSAGVGFALNAVRVNVRRVELYLPAGTSCSDIADLDLADGAYTKVCAGDKLRFSGPWQVDLVSGVATPPFAPEAVPAVRYRRIDVGLAPGDDDDDVTLLASGVVPFNGNDTPFRLALDFNEDVRFEGSGFTVAPGDAVASALLALDPGSWFASLPLSACAADGDLTIEAGVIVIEDGNNDCSDVENAVKDAVKASGTLR